MEYDTKICAKLDLNKIKDQGRFTMVTNIVATFAGGRRSLTDKQRLVIARCLASQYGLDWGDGTIEGIISNLIKAGVLDGTSNELDLVKNKVAILEAKVRNLEEQVRYLKQFEII
jgi:hypothetical protein